jgi:hypothetical protein
MLTSREAQQRASTAYSITLSVMAMSVCGIVIPSAFAVLRLIEGVGLLYGHLGGLRAFEDLVSEFGGAPEHSRHIWAVRDQAAGFGLGFASGATWRKNARRIGRVGSRKVRSKALFGRPQQLPVYPGEPTIQGSARTLHAGQSTSADFAIR